MKKFAVILSGSGVYDGSEIHEAVLSLYAIDKAGASYEIFAPDIPQHHVINHLSGEESNESRNVLVESARIARGKIKNLKAYKAADFDALLLPGGFGAAKNLSSFAFDGAECSIQEDVEMAIKETAKAGKIIGALCIAPAVLVRVLGKIDVTVGDDKATIEAIKAMNGEHQKTTHGEVVVDFEHKVVTTPCYMLNATISQIALGVENVVKAMLDIMNMSQ